MQAPIKDWTPTLALFIGLAGLQLTLYNGLSNQIASNRAEISNVRTEISGMHKQLANIRERLARVETRLAIPALKDTATVASAETGQ